VDLSIAASDLLLLLDGLNEMALAAKKGRRRYEPGSMHFLPSLARS
jgi:hypothetical protein